MERVLASTLKTCQIIDMYVVSSLARSLGQKIFWQGTNWVVSKSLNDTVGVAVSQNMEFLEGGGENKCVEYSVRGEGGPWLILSDFGWIVDKTVKMQCV